MCAEMHHAFAVGVRMEEEREETQHVFDGEVRSIRNNGSLFRNGIRKNPQTPGARWRNACLPGPAAPAALKKTCAYHTGQRVWPAAGPAGALFEYTGPKYTLRPE